MISLTSVASCFFWTQFFSNVDDRCATFEIPCLDSEQFLGNLCPVQVKFLPTPIIFLDKNVRLDTGFKNFGVTTSTISSCMYLHHVQSFVVQWYVSLFHYVFVGLFSYFGVFKDTLAVMGLPFSCRGCSFTHQIWSPSDSPGRKWMLETFEQ